MRQTNCHKVEEMVVNGGWGGVVGDGERVVLLAEANQEFLRLGCQVGEGGQRGREGEHVRFRWCPMVVALGVP